MSKIKPMYLVCHYNTDDTAIFPCIVTIAYNEIESDELNDKIASLVKDLEKKYEAWG